MPELSIQFLGAARTVTGSLHAVRYGERLIILDCGLYQGHRKEAFERNRRVVCPAREVDAVLLSHAHIDHSGNLPSLVSRGYKGSIYCTRATRDLAEVLLRDAGQIQERDADYLNRHLRPSEKVEPLYTERDALRAAARLHGVPYHEWIDVVEGVRARFFDAGHILGSAMVLLECGTGTETCRILFSGDLGRPGLPLLRDPEPMPEADVVLTESTYGDRKHEDAGDAKGALRKAVEMAVSAGGKLIIPAFSVGRTQNLLYFLHILLEEGAIAPIDIFVDSPLSVEASRVMGQHLDCYDAETQALLARDVNPFHSPHVHYVSRVEDSKRLNDLEGSAVIISASGMCEFGRILHHLAHHIEDPRNVLAFVGHQAPYTLGRRIADGVSPVRLLGELRDVKARVVRLSGFSAHADCDDLVRMLSPLRSRARRTFIVHGDLDQAEGLKRRLDALGFTGVTIPEEGETAVIA